jgi:hypothetical protein
MRFFPLDLYERAHSDDNAVVESATNEFDCNLAEYRAQLSQIR